VNCTDPDASRHFRIFPFDELAVLPLASDRESALDSRISCSASRQEAGHVTGAREHGLEAVGEHEEHADRTQCPRQQRDAEREPAAHWHL
jgi:hypothetical protein